MWPNCTVVASAPKPAVSVRPVAAADGLRLILRKSDLQRETAVTPVSRVSYRSVLQTQATGLQLAMSLLAGMPKLRFEFSLMVRQ
jgi:hypothetical protein